MKDGSAGFIACVKYLELTQLFLGWLGMIVLPFVFPTPMLETHIYIWLIAILLGATQIFDRNILCINYRYKKYHDTKTEEKSCCWDKYNMICCYNMKKDFWHATPLSLKYAAWFFIHLICFGGLTCWFHVAVSGT